MSALSVYFQETRCGTLTERAGGELGFQYHDDWIEQDRHSISIRLPVSEHQFPHETVAPFVASFLPEGETLRSRLEKLLHVDAQDNFGLLSALGRESAGALSFWPEHEEPFTSPPQYQPLSDEEFERWKEYAHQLPLQFQGRQLRLSLAGVQSKTALYFDAADRAHVPENGAPTTHILKPRIQGCRPSTVYVELMTMRLARAVLGEENVPEVDLWRNCYRIRRFDRPITEQGVIRLHQQDFCLAMGRMPKQKYEVGSPRERLLGKCFALIDELGEQRLILAPAMQRQKLLDQVILNVLLHNPDSHLKNYAFLYSPSGHLEITPLYDCLCTSGLRFAADTASGWATDRGPATHTLELSLQVGNATNVSNVSLEDWEAFALECGFTKAFVRRRLKSLAKRAAAELEPVSDAVIGETPNAEQAVRITTKGIRQQLDAVLLN